MPTYIAMLRGINVGGNNRIKMEALRACFASLGFKNVQTYIQSGNVIFQAPKISAAQLEKKITEKFTADFGFSSVVILRSSEELTAAIAANPFLKKKSVDLEKLHVVFLSATPTEDALKQLENLTRLPDESHCLGQEIYLLLPNGMGRCSLTNNPIERKFLRAATTRNWRTVNQLNQMCLDCR